MRYRGYAGLPVQATRASLPLACPMLARPPVTEQRQPAAAGPEYAGARRLSPQNDAGHATPGTPHPPDAAAASGAPDPSGALGTSGAPAASALPGTSPNANGGLAGGAPDAAGALPPVEGERATPGARRLRLILVFCGAAVTIGVGVAIALLMDEASVPLRVGTGSPAAVQTSGTSGAAPGHTGGGTSATDAGHALTDAACPLPGGPAACPAMVTVPAGRYRIGSRRNDPDAQQEEFGGTERPVAAFELSTHEITAGQWQQCVNEQACPPPAQAADSSAMPVTGISWDAAAAYAAWLSRKTGRQYRLPTEAEWEYAARAGSVTVFPWGDRLGQRNAQCGQCGALPDFPRFAPVGSYPARGGLYDMVGNAYEWVADCWTANHAQPLPPPTAACRDKVQKGGAFDTLEADVRPAARTHGDRTVPDPRVGFRVARAPHAPAPPPMSLQTTERTQR